MNLLVLAGLGVVGYAIFRRSEAANNVALKLRRRAARAAHRTGGRSENQADADDMDRWLRVEPDQHSVDPSGGVVGRGPSRPHGDPLIPRSN
jgi:hypothetical protein